MRSSRGRPRRKALSSRSLAEPRACSAPPTICSTTLFFLADRGHPCEAAAVGQEEKRCRADRWPSREPAQRRQRSARQRFSSWPTAATHAKQPRSAKKKSVVEQIVG